MDQNKVSEDQQEEEEISYKETCCGPLYRRANFVGLMVATM